jgi:hypothetical protein
MIDLHAFKSDATRFRKAARRLGFERQMATLLDIYSYSYFNLSYARMHSQLSHGHLPQPAFPPRFLETTAAWYGCDPALILEAMDVRRVGGIDQRTGTTLLGPEAWEQAAGRFEKAARAAGLGLSSSALQDLFSLAYFDQPFDEIQEALAHGDKLALPAEPAYLGAACVLFDVEERRVLPFFRNKG